MVFFPAEGAAARRSNGPCHHSPPRRRCRCLPPPLALPALIAKKRFRRWLLVPALRPFVAPIMNAILAGPVAKAVDAKPDEGCLVYYALRKRRQ